MVHRTRRAARSGVVRGHPWIGRRFRDAGTGREGFVLYVDRRPTFSALVPFVTDVTLRADDGSTFDVRRERLREVKRPSCGICGVRPEWRGSHWCEACGQYV